MAISGGDGSIILTTKVDESGITKSTTSIKTQFAKVGSYLKTIGTSIQTTFSKVGAGIKNTFSKIGNWLKNFATSIAAQFATIFGLYALINFSKQSAEFATQTEASVQRLVDIYGEAAESVGGFIDANARAIGMSKASASSFASVYGNLFSVWADQNTNAELTNRYLNMTAVVASKTGRTVQDVQERIRSGLLGNTEAIEDLGVFVNVKTIEMTDAFQRMADRRSWEQLDAYTQQQIRTMAILEQATAKYGNTVADTTATTRAQYQAAYEDFQNTWGQVVNTVLIPVLKVLTQVFTIATKGLQILAGLTGKTVDTSTAFSSQEKSIGGAVDNQNDLTDAVKGTNKELKKSLAGFDELNILSQENASASSGTGVTGGASGANVSDLGIGDLGGNYDNSFVDKVSGDMAAIMGIVGGALIAIGLILIFFGHIGWGIGFIIAGAAIFAVSMATIVSGDMTTPISNELLALLTTAGIALSAIGLILLFSGNIAWGIGFIIAGASALSVSIASTSSQDTTEGSKQMLLDIMLIAGTALLALGVILLFCGQVTPLSIGLVVAGAGSLAGAVAINPKEVGEKIKKFFKDNAGLIVGISLAILAIGIILCVCGIITPLSIGMIVAGAAGIVATIALNWEAFKKKVSSIIEQVGNWIKTYGLLVLGIILCLTGAGIPLGIALIIKWAKDGAEKGVPLATAIVDKVKEIWSAVKSFWNKHIAPVFTGKFWLDLAKKCGNGLIGGFESAVNSIIGMFEKMINWIVDGINKISFEVPDWVPLIGGKKFGFDIPKAKFSRVSIPRLAQGAVIPPNREFLAVLGDQKRGTNIEAPLDTIKQAVAEVLAQVNTGFGGNIEVPVIIDGREVARAVRNAESNMGTQTVFGGFANAY